MVGRFVTAGGAITSRIARWDGIAFAPLGGGTSGPISALADFDDGTGLALHVGGNVSTSPAGDRYLAKWGFGP